MIRFKVFAMNTALHSADQMRKNQNTYVLLNIFDMSVIEPYVKVYPTYAATSRIGADTMWFAELVERSATQINADSPAHSSPLHHACVASASGVNEPLLDENTSRIEAVSTYVQNAMSGMYKSGALISFRGGLYAVPPATLSGNRAHEPLCKNGHNTNRIL